MTSTVLVLSSIVCSTQTDLSPDCLQEEWPRRGPRTRSMLKGSPQWRQRITLRSGLAPPPSPRGGAILRTPETRCLMLSTRARRLSSITAPSLISSQSSSRKGQCRESARFCPSSLRRRLSFSDKLVSGWKRMTRGKPWNISDVWVSKERERQSYSVGKKLLVLKHKLWMWSLGWNINWGKFSDHREYWASGGGGRERGIFFYILQNIIPETEDHRPFQDWIKVSSLD